MHTANGSRATVAVADFRLRAPDLYERLRSLDVPAADATHDAVYRVELVDGRPALVATRGGARPYVLDLDRNPRRLGGADPLRRAIGRRARRVIDATAGLGGDTLHLARLGLEVVAVERCATLAVLLDDAVSRILDPAVRERITVVCDDGLRYLASSRADAVYLDPMFDRPGSPRALPRREMVLVRELAGCDEDAAALLRTARRCCRRVVVKRADKAPPLASGVHHAHHGKTVRYDVYIDPKTADREAS